MSKENINNCTFVKTILMILVILAHSVAFWTGKWAAFTTPVFQSNSLGYIYSWIATWAIHAFTFVSGYIFAYKITRDEYKAYRLFLKNKAKRLLVPYCFVVFIWVAPVSAYFFKWNVIHLFNKYILCISPSQLWFLWTLFWIFVITWPLQQIIINKPIIAICISIIFYAIGEVCSKLIPNIFCIWTALQYILYFCFGMIIRAKQEKGQRLSINLVPWYLWLLIDIFMFIVMIKTKSMIGNIWFIISYSIRVFLNVIGTIMAWCCLQNLAKHFNWKDSKSFGILSSCSMPIYLFHQQFIYFTIVWLNGKVSPLVNALANFSFAFICSLIVSCILKKWKVTRLLI